MRPLAMALVVAASLLAGCFAPAQPNSELVPAKPRVEVRLDIHNNATLPVWAQAFILANGGGGSQPTLLLVPGQSQEYRFTVQEGQDGRWSVAFGTTPLLESWRIGPYGVRAMGCGGTPSRLDIQAAYQSDLPSTGWKAGWDCQPLGG